MARHGNSCFADRAPESRSVIRPRSRTRRQIAGAAAWLSAARGKLRQPRRWRDGGPPQRDFWVALPVHGSAPCTSPPLHGGGLHRQLIHVFGDLFK